MAKLIRLDGEMMIVGIVGEAATGVEVEVEEVAEVEEEVVVLVGVEGEEVVVAWVEVEEEE